VDSKVTFEWRIFATAAALEESALIVVATPAARDGICVFPRLLGSASGLPFCTCRRAVIQAAGVLTKIDLDAADGIGDTR